MSVKTAIIIPARYASTRLPGKPLAMIAGKTMLQRVVEVAKKASDGIDSKIVVTTDDDRIEKHCNDINVDCIRTSPECPSGTDRVAQTVEKLNFKPDFVLNFQGDAPLTPPDFLRKLIDSFSVSPCDVITPVTKLKWSELDKARESKLKTPFSGTFVAFESNTGNALWFSKNIIPAIRSEEKLRKESEFSPIYRHIGIYGFSYDMLNKFVTLKEGKFEKLEGLEQLRILENGYKIRCVEVEYNGRPSMSGVDSPEDIKRAEDLLRFFGDKN